MPKLNFVGKQGSGLPGIPGRDLSASEVEQYGGEEALLKSGLYQKQSSSVEKSKTKSKREGE